MFWVIRGVGDEHLECFRANPLEYIGIVCEISKDYMNRGFEFEELVEYGIVGLLKACQRFDETIGVKFPTYAAYWIREEIRRAIINELHLIRVPEYMIFKKRRIDKGKTKSRDLKRGKDKYLEAARKIWEASFLGVVPDNTEQNYYLCSESSLPDYRDQEFQEYEEDNEVLRKELTKLDVREQRVIIMSYFQGMSMDRIVKATGMAKVTVCRLRKNALQKLRERMGAVGA